MEITREQIPNGLGHVTMKMNDSDLKRLGFEKFPTREEFIQRMRELMGMDKT